MDPPCFFAFSSKSQKFKKLCGMWCRIKTACTLIWIVKMNLERAPPNGNQTLGKTDLLLSHNARKKHENCAHISKMVTFVGNLFCRDKGGPKTCCTKWDNWITLSERYQGTPMRQCPSYLRGHTSRMKAISYFHELFLHQNNQNITQSPKHEESRIFLRKGNF